MHTASCGGSRSLRLRPRLARFSCSPSSDGAASASQTGSLGSTPQGRPFRLPGLEWHGARRASFQKMGDRAQLLQSGRHRLVRLLPVLLGGEHMPALAHEEQMQGVGGSGLCPHQCIMSTCKECGGASVCQHQRRKSECKELGASICPHQRIRSKCPALLAFAPLALVRAHDRPPASLNLLPVPPPAGSASPLKGGLQGLRCMQDSQGFRWMNGVARRFGQRPVAVSPSTHELKKG